MLENPVESHEAVIEYWRSIGPDGWFRRDDEVDAAISKRFQTTLAAAAAGKLDSWLDNPMASLALVLILDQFPRNMFRGDPRAFATDGKAREIAAAALAREYHREVDPQLATFFFMPFMHSESIADQDRCVALMHRFGTGQHVKFARLHRDIIRRFCRFPHRNSALGRHSSPAEKTFLENGGFSA